jgi:hypothetical protein
VHLFRQKNAPIFVLTASTNLPTKKVADGANTTYMLVCQNGRVDYKADNYQNVISQTAEGFGKSIR